MNFMIVTDAPQFCGASPALPVPVAPPAEPRPAEAPQRTYESAPRSFSAAANAARANRRWSQRTGIDRPGFAVTDAQAQAFPCAVRDLSKFGALIEMDGDSLEALPDCFMLVFCANRIRSEANCVLVTHDPQPALADDMASAAFASQPSPTERSWRADHSGG